MVNGDISKKLKKRKNLEAVNPESCSEPSRTSVIKSFREIS